MKTETYASARARLLADLSAIGFATRPALKVPWAEPPGGGYRLWFKPQAVHLNEHSLWLDIRGMLLADFLAHVEKAVSVRRSR